MAMRVYLVWVKVDVFSAHALVAVCNDRDIADAIAESIIGALDVRVRECPMNTLIGSLGDAK